MRHAKLTLTTCLAALAMNACAANESQVSEGAPSEIEQTSRAYTAFGRIVALDPAMADHVALDAKVEKLAEGFWWAEGPSWDPVRNQLYFTDVPQNKMFSWSERDGLKTYLDPSGLDLSSLPENEQTLWREPGVNGTWMAPDGSLLLANHGARGIERMNLETGERALLIGEYKGLSLNSPNDLVLSTSGDIYFTDPPFGLKNLDDSPLKEQPHNGVYRLSADGTLKLIDDSLTRPNGVALSPDEQHLYVTNSDPKLSKIMRYTKQPDGRFGQRELWLDTQGFLDSGLQGNPDGLAVAADGTVYSTGPGGVMVISPQGKLLGRIMVGDDPRGKKTANTTLGGPDGKTLYLTSQDTLARVRVKSGR